MTQGRIAARFSASPGRKLLVPYITAGDPDLETTLALMHTLVKAGADIIELGVPFSDPMADGPVIQAACERALGKGVTLAQVLETVRAFRETDTDTAVVLMGYLNPVEIMGYEQFAKSAGEVGVDGVLTVDMPPEESAELVEQLTRYGLDRIFLLSPTTPDSRLRAVCEQASGYIYYVSLKGVTGAANLDTTAVAERVRQIKSVASIPVAVGFGIRDAQSAATISTTADAVVVGSALVSIVQEHGSHSDALHDTLYQAVRDMRIAMDEAQALT